MGLIMVVLRLELLGEKRLFLRFVPIGEGEFLGACLLYTSRCV